MANIKIYESRLTAAGSYWDAQALRLSVARERMLDALAEADEAGVSRNRQIEILGGRRKMVYRWLAERGRV